jgi:hypothetical protein
MDLRLTLAGNAAYDDFAVQRNAPLKPAVQTTIRSGESAACRAREDARWHRARLSIFSVHA